MSEKKWIEEPWVDIIVGKGLPVKISYEDYQRAMLCVNALAGIENPKAFVEVAHELRYLIPVLMAHFLGETRPDKESIQTVIAAFDEAKGKP